MIEDDKIDFKDIPLESKINQALINMADKIVNKFNDRNVSTTLELELNATMKKIFDILIEKNTLFLSYEVTEDLRSVFFICLNIF